MRNAATSLAVAFRKRYGIFYVPCPNMGMERTPNELAQKIMISRLSCRGWNPRPPNHEFDAPPPEVSWPVKVQRPCYQPGSPAKIQQAIGPHENLLIIVKRRILQYCNDMVMSPVHQVWPKPSCKAQSKGEEELVSWCFKPSQPQRITSGLKTNFSLSPSYSWNKF